MTKNVFDGRVETTREGDLFQMQRIKFGFFKHQVCDFSVEKANMPEMTIFYVNQAYESYKDNKKVYYCDFYILGQVTPCLNPLKT